MSETLDLDAVRRRLNHYQSHRHGAIERGWGCCSAHGVAEDVPALLAEVERLYVGEAMLRRRVVALERLTACYRTGRTPSEALLNELDTTHAGVMAE